MTGRWKVYDAHRTYQAACKEINAAGALMAHYGPGATIKDDHSIIVWKEGREHDGEQCATHSFDDLIHVVNQRCRARDLKAQQKRAAADAAWQAEQTARRRASQVGGAFWSSVGSAARAAARDEEEA